MNSAAGQTKFKSCPPKNLPSMEKDRDQRMNPGQERARQKESCQPTCKHLVLLSGRREPKRRKRTNLTEHPVLATFTGYLPQSSPQPGKESIISIFSDKETETREVTQLVSRGPRTDPGACMNPQSIGSFAALKKKYSKSSQSLFAVYTSCRVHILHLSCSSSPLFSMAASSQKQQVESKRGKRQGQSENGKEQCLRQEFQREERDKILKIGFRGRERGWIEQLK